MTLLVPYHKIAGRGLSALISDNIPEVQKAARVQLAAAWIQSGNTGFHQTVVVTDENFLNIFSFPLLQGDPKRVLREPFSVLLTQKMAIKLFGNQSPLGKPIKMEERDLKGNYIITGVLKDIPNNSTIQFDFLTTPTPSARKTWERWLPKSTYRPVETYLKVEKTSKEEDLERKLQAVMVRYMGDEIAVHNTYRLQKLTRIHLYSRQDFNLGRQGNVISELYHLGLLAILILSISCFNYMNLTTALSLKRAREIGMRKMFGAQRAQLIRQFLGESTSIAWVAFFVSLALLGICLPYFNTLTGKNIPFNLIGEHSFWLLGGSLFTILVGILAGSYPALLISSRQPISALKRTGLNKRGGMQKYLVVFQLSISVFLVISMIVIYRQLTFIRTKDLGYNKDRVVMLPVFWTANQLRDSGVEALRGKSDLVKQAFLNHPNILEATASQFPLGSNTAPASFKVGGEVHQEWRMWQFPVDEDFLEFFSIDLKMGRNFSNMQNRAANQEFILNEEAVKKLGGLDPTGQPLEYVTQKQLGTVIGVAENFHFHTLHKKIEPMVLFPTKRWFKWLYLKIRKENEQETLAFLKKQWRKFIPIRPLEWHFLDDRLLQRFYQPETRMAQTVNTFVVISVFIMCLGLLGLVAFMVEQRKKEIGTRKVLGASHYDIMRLFAKGFLTLNVLANLTAWPLAYYFTDYWLKDFEYQFGLGLWDFLMGGALIIVVTLTTISIQTFQASQANPVDVLKES